MKAVVYNGPRDVSVKNVPDAKIEQPNDVIVRSLRPTFAVLTCICTRAGPIQTGRRFWSREHR